MTDLYETEQAIRTSLATIRAYWSALLTPATSGGQNGGSATNYITLDDHDERDHDIDRATRIVSLRREVIDVLNAISRWVMEERPVTKALPDGTSALSMSLFLDRHAGWVAAEDDGYEVDRLAGLAHRVQQMAVPKRRDWVYLGDCPFIVEDWFCAGQVRQRIGGDAEASCSDCGQTAVTEWWENVLGISQPPCTAPVLAKTLHHRLGFTVTDRTIRNWVRDGIIHAYAEPYGPAPQWTRYDPAAVMEVVARMGRACTVCGNLWEGYGDVCRTCWADVVHAAPTRAEPKASTPVAASLTGWCPWPRNVVPDPHDTDRPDRCHWSDLPMNQCACGRHASQMVDVKTSA